MCGKKALKNQPCWLQDVNCGQPCGKTLKCGSHMCRKPCHRPGECEDAGGRACQQPCGKEKSVCGHPDENICHAPYPCKEDKPCPHKIFITCECQAQKQEMKCNASKSSEGNLAKSLPCNEECARLERNRKLALALNIDRSTHVDGGDHIPYSNDTLTMFQEHVKWAQTQEREFRVFAAADDEKRLRFKPMPARQRAFIHSLAEDFGLDSESMDPEPHRHVAIFKTPKFLTAPNKTLAECVRIRVTQRAALAKDANASDGDAEKKIRSNEVGEPFNAFVIANPRFGLTIDEVRAELNGIVPASAALQFDIEFLPNDEVIIKALTRTLPAHDLEAQLKTMKPSLTTALAAKAIGRAQLCHADSSLNILRRESDGASSDGWSRVAAKGAAPRKLGPQQTIGGNNSFAALGGNKVTFAKKKPVKVEKVEVVDDWEAAETAEEEKEMAASKEKEGESGAGSEGDEGVVVDVDGDVDGVGVSTDGPGAPRDRVELHVPVAEENAVVDTVSTQPAASAEPEPVAEATDGEAPAPAPASAPAPAPAPAPVEQAEEAHGDP